ncbi:MAG: phosphate ABC transporter permease PstA [Jatrophihabitantaceae bacterium]
MTTTWQASTADSTSTDLVRIVADDQFPATVPDQPTAVTSMPADQPRPLSRKTLDDRASLWASMLAALAFVWVVYEHVLQWSGTVGFIVCVWVCFLGCYAGVSALSHPLPIVKDRVAAAVVTSAALLVGFALATTLISTLWKGWPALHHLNFYTKDLTGIGPATDPLTKGGIYHAIVGTALEVMVAVVISLPLGIGTAVFLSEVRGPGTRLVRTVVEAMTALPDILAGLFVYTLLILILGWERSGFAAAVALSITMTPIIARSAEVVLRVVPSGLREASMALGASHWQTVRRVVLPTAKAGLATSLILGIARVAGETAPLLIVSGSSIFTNHDLLHHNMNSLPLFVYLGVKSGQGLYIQRAYGAASVLLLLVLTLFIITRLLARNRTGKS